LTQGLTQGLRAKLKCIMNHHKKKEVSALRSFTKVFTCSHTKLIGAVSSGRRLILFWQRWNLYNVIQGWHLLSALLIHMPNHTRFPKRMKKAIKSSGSQRAKRPKRMEQADSRRSLEATPAMFAAVVTMATLTTLAPSCLSSSTLSVSASTQIFSSCRKGLTAKL